VAVPMPAGVADGGGPVIAAGIGSDAEGPGSAATTAGTGAIGCRGGGSGTLSGTAADDRAGFDAQAPVRAAAIKVAPAILVSITLTHGTPSSARQQQTEHRSAAFGRLHLDLTAVQLHDPIDN
jgi:hypothetical protein